MPEEPDLDALWQDWVASEEASELEKAILSDLHSSVHLFDIHDGDHAGWVGDRLGVLLVFDLPDAIQFSAEEPIEDPDRAPVRWLVTTAVETLIDRALEIRGY